MKGKNMQRWFWTSLQVANECILLFWMLRRALHLWSIKWLQSEIPNLQSFCKHLQQKYLLRQLSSMMLIACTPVYSVNSQGMYSV